MADGDVPRGPLQGVLDSERFNLLRSLEFFAGFVRVRAPGKESLLASHPFAGARHVRTGETGERFVVIGRDSLSAFKRELPEGITLQEPEGDLETVLSEWMR